MYPAQSKRRFSSPRISLARPRTSHVASRTWNAWKPEIALRVITHHISSLTISTVSVMVSCNQLVRMFLPDSVAADSANQSRVSKNLPQRSRYHALDQKINQTAEPPLVASRFPDLTI